jgi:hypothetical protein
MLAELRDHLANCSVNSDYKFDGALLEGALHQSNVALADDLRLEANRRP